ncbi:response regulator [Bacillus solimangrovi]|uniref:Response regulatory domain-containing protein n=1 Tax=Bacillus solimangrovi TaxID=1305675 RepID=A0A1E5LJM1_9BACI|nr:response regulator [Bacillus solimangrovi]OEH94293.1 hypothetical protein BFG57_08535 [Bacillus solimangrovi]
MWEKEHYLKDIEKSLVNAHQNILKMPRVFYSNKKNTTELYHIIQRLKNSSAVFQEKEIHEVTLYLLRKFVKDDSNFILKLGQEKAVFQGIYTLLNMLGKHNIQPRHTLLKDNDSNLKMVVIDNDDPFLQTIREEVVSDGEECHCYSDVISIQELISIDPDVIVVNMLLPNKEGFQFIERVREHKLTKSIPIIAITHSSEEAHYEAIISSSVDNYLRKPFSSSLLVNCAHFLVKQLTWRKHKLGNMIQEHQLEMTQLIHKEWMRFVRFHSEFCLIYLNFEIHGTETVDNYLYQVYEEIRQTLRKYDDVKMWNNHSMVILLPQTNLQNGNLVSRRIMNVLQTMSLGEALQSQIRIGVMESELSLKSEQSMIERFEEKLLKKTTPFGLHVFPLLTLGLEEIVDNSGRKKVLIVDDDLITTSLIQNHLSDEEWEVEICTNVKRAIELAVTFKPDFIISELKMSDLDGYFFCHQIRQFPQLKDTDFYFLTYQTLPQHMVRAYEVGADEYMTKPFSVHVLAAKMRNAQIERL